MATRHTWKANTLLALALLWTGLIVFLSLAQLEKLTIVELKFSDKLYHAVCYFILAILWILFFFVKDNFQNVSGKILLILSLTLFGIIIEILQVVLTSYRTFDWWDAMANAVGIILARLFFNVIENYLIKK